MSRTPFIRVLLAIAMAAIWIGGPPPAANPTARAVSDDVLISQVYGGGGNGGAPLTNDFIELFNRGASPVDLTGWSVQYASAAGSSWQKTDLVGTMPPGSYYLVLEAGGAEGSPPPEADAAGSISLAQGAGKIALVTSQAPLRCGTASQPCLPGADIRDFVGYGTSASTFEGAGPTPTLSSRAAALRRAGGCTDSDQNALDFIAAAPNPRNTSTTVLVCAPPARGIRIHDIQGAGHISPLVDMAVLDVPGIVTATRTNGFYLQDPSPDTDDRTSEGIFVFTSASPSVGVGDHVTVSGTVSEFRPNCRATTCSSSDSAFANLTTTEIVSVAMTTVSSGNAVPTPVVIGAAGRMPPTTVIDADTGGNVETGGSFDPSAHGIDFYESLEGMLVEVRDPTVVGLRNTRGEIPVLADLGADTGLRTPRGGLVLRDGDANPERIILDNAIVSTPHVDVGDVFTGAVAGVMDYSFGNFKLVATSLPAISPRGLTRETAITAITNELAIATFNLENLDPGDGPAKFDALAAEIVTNLGAPDLIGVQEVQDSNGPVNDTEVGAAATITMLTDAILAAGGPAYQYRDIAPERLRDGGERGGNIRVGFLFRTDRGLRFVDRPGGDATTAVDLVSGVGGPELSASPGRIDPTNPVFEQSRKPLVGEFRYNERPLFVINVHLVSRLGDDPLFGRFQPPRQLRVGTRIGQAQVVHAFVAALLAADPDARVIVLGDFNDYQFAPALATVAGSGLHNLTNSLPEEERYSFIYEGNGQAFDHILVSQRLFDSLVEHDIVHVNAELVDQASDHDPARALFSLPP